MTRTRAEQEFGDYMPLNPTIDDRLEPILRLVNDDREAGLKQLTVFAEAGDRSAILFLGLYLSEEETTEAAVKWLIVANDFESADAARRLG